MKTTDVIVIGGGAAGMMCAATAGLRGRRVILLEKEEKVGKKIKISGGGRCNFTNLGATADRYISQQKDFCKSALSRYTPSDFLQLIDKHGIGYHEKKLGQQFCDDGSQGIIDMMIQECEDVGVEFVANCTVQEVSKTEKFIVKTNQDTWEAESVVIATGGLSFPKLGATDFGYKVAGQFGLKITELRPGLVPLVLVPKELDWIKELSGVSLDTIVSKDSKSFRENILFTHRGLSGPAILQISSYWKPGETIVIDLLPECDAVEWLKSQQSSKVQFNNVLAQKFPHRFADHWCKRYAEMKPINQIKLQKLQELGEMLNGWKVMCPDSEGYPKAEVTIGGVDTKELSSKTMEARQVPGLFFIGEVVDVTGWLGGYNFQWAWASGHAAGEVV